MRNTVIGWLIRAAAVLAPVFWGIPAFLNLLHR